MAKITKQDLDRMIKAGTIRGYKQINQPKEHKKNTRIPQSEAKQVSWLRFQLQYWAKENDQVLWEEHRFCLRKWRFDFAFPALMIAIEYEGINSAKSGHTTLVGYTKDTEKYNEAAKIGWTLIRFTAVNYKTAITKLTETWKQKQIFSTGSKTT